MNKTAAPAMKKINSRFGELEYDPNKVLCFPEGLIGFEELREFVVMPNHKQGPLFWIQSVDDPEIAFVLTDPTNFFLDYAVIPEDEEMKKLGITEKEDCFVLSVVTVHPDSKVTLNLMAPVLFSAKTNRALQVILEGSQYSTSHPLPV
jgi:flagellar assembly factor FliW